MLCGTDEVLQKVTAENPLLTAILSQQFQNGVVLVIVSYIGSCVTPLLAVSVHLRNNSRLSSVIRLANE